MRQNLYEHFKMPNINYINNVHAYDYNVMINMDIAHLLGQ